MMASSPLTGFVESCYSPDAHGWAPTEGQLDLFGKEIPDDLYVTRDSTASSRFSPAQRPLRNI